MPSITPPMNPRSTALEHAIHYTTDESTIYRTRSEHAIHYTTDAILINLKILCTTNIKQDNLTLNGIKCFILFLGGHIIIAMREEYLYKTGFDGVFEPLMKQLENEKIWKMLSRKQLTSFAFGLSGILYVFQKS
jgi:hypothetical protein